MKSDIANIRKQQRRWWNWCTNDVNWYLCLFRHHIPVILSHEVTHDKVFVTVPLVILLNVPYFPHRLYLNYMRWTLDKYCRISTNFFLLISEFWKFRIKINQDNVIAYHTFNYRLFFNCAPFSKFIFNKIFRYYLTKYIVWF